LTLVELVLAFALFAFLMASVGHLVLTSLRVQRTWGQTVVPLQSAERALNRLAHDLQAAQPLFDVPFRGNVNEPGLAFARLGPMVDAENRTTTDWLRIVYRLDRAGDDVALVREEFSYRAGAAEGEPMRQEVLAHLTSGQWTFGVLDEDGAVTWTPSWDGAQDGIPRLVKFDGGLLSRIIRNPSGTLPVSQP